ncbi:MAG: helix-turn-helix transcriptional regulator [Pedobacter sp.]|nr:helix-turn-helix transcriptional regulator [Pedobacter sp.]
MSQKKFNPAVANQARILIGSFFRERRKELGLKLSELAEMTGTTQPQLTRFENGEQNITINTLFALCGCLRIKPYFEEVEDLENEVPGFGKVDLN